MDETWGNAHVLTKFTIMELTVEVLLEVLNKIVDKKQPVRINVNQYNKINKITLRMDYSKLENLYLTVHETAHNGVILEVSLPGEARITNLPQVN